MKRRRWSVVAFVLVFAVATASTAVAALPSSTSMWHLDRVNQRSLPLDSNADFGGLTGAGVNVYIVDSGIRPTHEQFGGRVFAGTDPVSVTQPGQAVNPLTSDCDGHGTHVAGIAAGSTVGVARGANVIAVRVLNCAGDGTVENVVAALKWVRSHHVSGTAAVVNLSIGVDRNGRGEAIDHEVKELVKEGVVVAIAAGNSSDDACGVSPAHVPEALTIGASTVTDAVASYSNVGACVDLFAPGGDSANKIVSSWFGMDVDPESKQSSFQYPNSPSDDAWYFLDVGTSMASPLVAGYAALLAQQQPGLCADQISNAIVERATPNVLTGVSSTTPNRLMFVDTTPVVASTPGMPTNVISSISNGSVLVSWEPPCDGGSPLTGTTVSLLLNGKVVQKRNMAPGVQIARFSKLRNGVQYRVVVKASNALGEGLATTRWKSPVVRTLRPGQTVAASSIGRIGDGLSLKWKVSSATKSVCKVLTNPTRIRFTRSGTCRVAIRTNAGGVAAVHNLRVG